MLSDEQRDEIDPFMGASMIDRRRVRRPHAVEAKAQSTLGVHRGSRAKVPTELCELLHLARDIRDVQRRLSQRT